MFALRPGTGRWVGGGGAGFGMHALPWPLRRTVRFLSRLGSGDVAVPRFAATMASAALLGATGLYGAWLGGHMPAIVQAVTAHSGFAIDKVEVTGNRETSEIDVLGKIGLDGWTSMVGFSADAARKRIAELPWVQTVAVRKIYPATLDVAITEKTPFAIWQHGSDLTLIEKDGAPIAPFTESRYASLPLVVGAGGAERAAAIVAKLARYPQLAGRVKGYIRVGERRWDLRLENGITIKLPEGGEEEALADLVRMDRDDSLLSRDIVAVDLRLDDRIVVQLSPEAASAREAALKEQAKKPRRPERKT